jgi:hypothetical protein
MKGVKEETVYQMTKNIFENLDRARRGAFGRQIDQARNALEGMPVPLHPGAARYLQGKGPEGRLVKRVIRAGWAKNLTAAQTSHRTTSLRFFF